MIGVDVPILKPVLLAALTHAAWNAWQNKSSTDFVGLAAISKGWQVLGVAGFLFGGLPASSHWPYLLLTTVVHTIYAALLVNAYRQGQLSPTYPIARGSGPMIGQRSLFFQHSSNHHHRGEQHDAKNNGSTLKHTCQL